MTLRSNKRTALCFQFEVKPDGSTFVRGGSAAELIAEMTGKTKPCGVLKISKGDESISVAMLRVIEYANISSDQDGKAVNCVVFNVGDLVTATPISLMDWVPAVDFDWSMVETGS